MARQGTLKQHLGSIEAHKDVVAGDRPTAEQQAARQETAGQCSSRTQYLRSHLYRSWCALVASSVKAATPSASCRSRSMTSRPLGLAAMPMFAPPSGQFRRMIFGLHVAQADQLLTSGCGVLSNSVTGKIQ